MITTGRDFLITAHYRQILTNIVAAHPVCPHADCYACRVALMVKVDEVLDEWLVAEGGRA